MPSSSLSVEMTGEEAKLFQSFQNVIRQASSFEQSLDKSGQAAKGLAREERAMAREAKRAFEEARPPLERYNETKRKLQSLLEKGKITQGEYTAAVRRSKQEMESAGQAGEQAWGAKQLGNLKSYVLGVASLSAGLGLVKGALGEINQLAAEAAQRARGSIQDFGGLRQVATSQQDFEQLVSDARQIQGMGLDESRAAQMVFAGRSAGMRREDIQFMGLTAATGFVGEPAGMAKNIEALKTVMGEGQVGSFREILAQALAASGGAPAAADRLLEAAATGASGMGSLKISPEELLAATAVVSRGPGGADKAGTNMASLLRSLAEAAAKGDVDLAGAGGLMDMVGRVEAMGLDDAELQQLFGRSEARSALRVLSQNRGAVAGLHRQVGDAVGTGLLQERMGFRDPSLDAAIAAQQARAMRDVSVVPLGEAKNRAETLQALQSVALREAGFHEATIQWNQLRSGLTNWGDPMGAPARFGREWLDPPESVMGTPAYRQGLQRIAADRESFGIMTPEQNQRLDELLDKFDVVAGHLERAAAGGPALVAPGEDR